MTQTAFNFNEAPKVIDPLEIALSFSPELQQRMASVSRIGNKDLEDEAIASMQGVPPPRDLFSPLLEHGLVSLKPAEGADDRKDVHLTDLGRQVGKICVQIAPPETPRTYL